MITYRLLQKMLYLRWIYQKVSNKRNGTQGGENTDTDEQKKEVQIRTSEKLTCETTCIKCTTCIRPALVECDGKLKNIE
jgi:hypothetical protein